MFNVAEQGEGRDGTDRTSVPHLKRIRVIAVLVDAIEELVVEVGDVRRVVRCPYCRVHYTRRFSLGICRRMAMTLAYHAIPMISQTRMAIVRAARRVVRSSHMLERALRILSTGGPYNSLAARLVPQPTDYPAQTLRGMERHGVYFEVDISDVVGWYLYWGIEDTCIAALDEFLNPNDVYIDVGANIGVTTCVASLIVGSGGRVVAIEPSSPNHDRLLYHIRINGLTNVEAYQVALSDTRAVLKIGRPTDHNQGRNRVMTDGEEVSALPLDDLVAEIGLERVDFIKIDVEGWEPHVLAGAARVLEKYRPTLFVECVESNLSEYSATSAGLLSTISGLGYTLLDAATRLHVSEVDGPSDVICFPR